MLPISLTLTGFKGIKDGIGQDTITLDFSNLPTGLIAIIGENGRGKTTLMDNMHPYRIMPYKLRDSRDWSTGAFSYYEECYGRDGLKDLVFEENGVRYRSLLYIDSERRKTEAFVFVDNNGEWVPYNDAVKDGKTGPYDQAIEEICGSPTLFFSSRFRSQDARKLSSCPRSEILDVVCELLNIDHIKEQGEKSSKVTNALTADVDDLERQRARYSEAIAKGEELKEREAEVVTSIGIKETALSALRDELAATRKSMHDLELANAAQAVSRQRLQEMQLRHSSLIEEIEKLNNDAAGLEAEFSAESSGIEKMILQEESALKADVDAINSDLERERNAAHNEIGSISVKRQEAEAVLGRRSEIEAAVTREAELVAEATEVRTRYEASRSHYGELRVKLAELQSVGNEIKSCEMRLQDLAAQRSAAAAIVARSGEIENAYKREGELETEIIQLRNRVEDTRDSSNALREKMNSLAAVIGEIKSTEARLEDLKTQAANLEGLDCFADASGRINESCRLLSAAVSAKQQIPELVSALAGLNARQSELTAVREQLNSAELAEKELSSSLATFENELNGLRKLAAMKPELDSATVKGTELAKSICGVEAELNALKSRYSEIDSIQRQMDETEKTGKELAATYSALDEKVIEARTLASLQGELAGADARISELQLMEAGATSRLEAKVAETSRRISDLTARSLERKKDLTARLNALTVKQAAAVKEIGAKSTGMASEASALAEEIRQLDSTLNGDIVEELANLDNCVYQLNEDISEVEDSLKSLTAILGGVRSQLSELAEIQIAVEAIDEEITVIKEEIVNWKILTKSCSNDGIIALEIDDAGPAISATTNDLLKACYGSRFTVRIETQGEKTNGELKEVFDIIVYDAERGSVKSIRKMSGGEVTYIEDAITRAFCLYNLERSGIGYDSLFSDEKDGALDERRKREYMNIKRRALEIGGHDREFFISQTKELYEQANAWIAFSDSYVEIKHDLAA